MKLMKQKYIITVDQEIEYGRRMKKAAILSGQIGKLPEKFNIGQRNRMNSIKSQCETFFHKSPKPITAFELKEGLGMSEINHAHNYIQRLVLEGVIKKSAKNENSRLAEYEIK